MSDLRNSPYSRLESSAAAEPESKPLVNQCPLSAQAAKKKWQAHETDQHADVPDRGKVCQRPDFCLIPATNQSD